MSALRFRDARFFAETMRKRAVHSTCILAILFWLAPLANSTAVLALQSAPAPKNLRVTGVTDWTVTLTWDAPKGKAPASYVVQCSNGQEHDRGRIADHRHVLQRLRLQQGVFVQCVRRQFKRRLVRRQ